MTDFSEEIEELNILLAKTNRAKKTSNKQLKKQKMIF